MNPWETIFSELKLHDLNAQGVFSVGKKTKSDPVIWSIVALLVIVSLLAVYSATGSLAYKINKGDTEFYLFKQLFFIGAGIGIIYITHLLNYQNFSKIAVWFYLISLPLLIFTLFFGTNLNDASRWIRLPGTSLSFQTSDFARLALFMYLARQIARNQKVIHDLKHGYLPLLFAITLTCILIAPANLSTSILTFATGLIILFIGRAKIKHILSTIAIASLPILLLVMVAVITYKPVDTTHQTNQVQSLHKVQSFGRVGTWISRIQSFLYAKGDEIPFQVEQAKIAIAKGKWIGLGPGNSHQRNFLPHPYSDYIYAIIIEEYGLLGGTALLFFYLIFLYRSIAIVRRFPFAFGTFLALALSVTLVIQAFTNMAVTVGIFPVTGVTLPLVSMGGTSFLFTCFAIGILLSIARNVEETEKSVASKNTLPPNNIESIHE